MKTSKFQLTLGLVLACAAFTFSLAVRAQAQTVTNFANFDGVDGARPFGQTVMQATNGRLYGTTTYSGGASGIDGMGNVYELTPSGKLSNFYSFCSLANCADGANPFGTPILGSDGNLYGVTAFGGSDASGLNGAGTVYKLTLEGKLTTLYAFCPTLPCTDGVNPNGIIQASDGNLYGATGGGGQFGDGTIFEITSTGEFKSLYSFCSLVDCVDGRAPQEPPIQGNDGNFYGTTAVGGTEAGGVFYELTASGTYTVLHNFCSLPDENCPEGTTPGPIVQDASGNFFGTTYEGGSHAGNYKGFGTVFKITPANQFSVLQSFNILNAHPSWGVLLANDGNLYGSTQGSVVTGINNGTLFEITPENVFTELYAFGEEYPGSYVNTPLFQATDGNLYGTTTYGGSPRYNYGTVFRVSNGLSPLVETVPVRGTVGTSVLILGNNLTGSTSVTFNGASAEFTVESDSYIKATVPTGATTGVVSVVTPSGTLNSNPQFVVSK
jgi:uncharacterized repeat protein (TIGR03803 family)